MGRRCSCCGVEYESDNFYKNQSQCKSCYGEICKNYQTRTRNNRNRHRRRKEELVNYLGGECVICGESHHQTLQMHHLKPEEKEFSFGYLSAFRNADWESGLWKNEADKCICLCANCHFLHHTSVISIDNTGVSYNTEEEL